MHRVTAAAALLVLGTIVVPCLAANSPWVGRIHAVAASKVPVGAVLTVGNTGALDSATPCPTDPAIAIQGNAPNLTAHIVCQPLGWAYYVPVKVAVPGFEIVATKDLRPGQIIHPGDVRRARTTEQPPAGIVQQLATVIGTAPVVPVSRGSPLRLGTLRRPIIVHAGQHIVVHVHSGAVSLTATAVALQQGRADQSILVKNPTTGKRYRVTVNRSGSATYNMGR